MEREGWRKGEEGNKDDSLGRKERRGRKGERERAGEGTGGKGKKDHSAPTTERPRVLCGLIAAVLFTVRLKQHRRSYWILRFPSLSLSCGFYMFTVMARTAPRNPQRSASQTRPPAPCGEPGPGLSAPLWISSRWRALCFSATLRFHVVMHALVSFAFLFIFQF